MLEDSLKLQYKIDLKKVGSGNNFRNSVKKKKKKEISWKTNKFYLNP